MTIACDASRIADALPDRDPLADALDLLMAGREVAGPDKEIWTRCIKKLTSMLDERRRLAGLPGRPHLSASREEDRVVQTKVPASVKAAAERASSAEGMSLAAWVRRAILKAASSGGRPQVARAILDELVCHGVVAERWLDEIRPPAGGPSPLEQAASLVELAMTRIGS